MVDMVLPINLKDSFCNTFYSLLKVQVFNLIILIFVCIYCPKNTNMSILYICQSFIQDFLGGGGGINCMTLPNFVVLTAAIVATFVCAIV